MYQKEKNQITVHKTAADMGRRDEANRSGRISFAKRQRDMVCRCLVE